jgi:hypothetical protein
LPGPPDIDREGYASQSGQTQPFVTRAAGIIIVESWEHELVDRLEHGDLVWLTHDPTISYWKR